jgi:ADP-ribose pyrophosphatase
VLVVEQIIDFSNLYRGHRMSSHPIESCFQFCPSCGTESSDVGNVPFRCSKCEYANFFGPVAAVGGLIVSEGQLLLVRRARDPGRGKWGLPGGFVDRNETIEEALAREVMEEIGMKLTESDYLVSYPNQYDYRGMVAPVIDLFYICKIDTSEKIVLDQEELDHFEWVRPTDEYLDQMAFPSNRRAIVHWMSQAT